jgi:hypothetical protein
MPIHTYSYTHIRIHILAYSSTYTNYSRIVGVDAGVGIGAGAGAGAGAAGVTPVVAAVSGRNGVQGSQHGAQARITAPSIDHTRVGTGRTTLQSENGAIRLASATKYLSVLIIWRMEHGRVPICL